MIIETYKDIEIQAGGLSYEGVISGTVNIDIHDPAEYYRITATPTPSMASNYAVATTGTPSKGHKIVIKYEATVDFNGNNLTLMGLTIDESYEAKKFILESTYDGSAWVTVVNLDFDQSDIIITSSIKDDAVTTGKIVNNAVTTSKIVDGAVTADKLGSDVAVIKSVSGTISGANVLTAASSPVVVVPLVAGKLLAPFSINLTLLAAASPAFATNTTVQIMTSTAGTVDPIAELDCLGVTGSSPAYNIPLYTPTAGNIQFQAGKNIVFQVKTGNPTGGTFDINYTILYYER